jgi:hypothetical protein
MNRFPKASGVNNICRFFVTLYNSFQKSFNVVISGNTFMRALAAFEILNPIGIELEKTGSFQEN